MESRFLFREDCGDVFTLNATGALVHRLYRQGTAPEDIAQRLARSHGIPPARALADVLAFLSQVRIHGLLSES
ncbi:MAG: PqqD family protein [Candidatus Rokubacteria bacterium]|nr:PqqD family protein [Candidatus Rokubacteria bacterium]MBI3104928.1 PqqD family protein [Candidatus Rokubacteria bacterium]